MSCNNCSSCSCETKGVVHEFVPGKEYAVGEFFKIDNEVFKVIHDVVWNQCDACDFYGASNCSALNCTDSGRTAGNSVQAILYDTEE